MWKNVVLCDHSDLTSYFPVQKENLQLFFHMCFKGMGYERGMLSWCLIKTSYLDSQSISSFAAESIHLCKSHMHGCRHLAYSDTVLLSVKTHQGGKGNFTSLQMQCCQTETVMCERRGGVSVCVYAFKYTHLLTFSNTTQCPFQITLTFWNEKNKDRLG